MPAFHAHRADRSIPPAIARMLGVLVLGIAASMPCGLHAANGGGEKRPALVATGDVAPDFALPDQDGRRHALSAEHGKRPVVLVFYRGHW
jgi:cytochrome oxidase Cu insertion factor (SCO1/SenC/PrrC family)